MPAESQRAPETVGEAPKTETPKTEAKPKKAPAPAELLRERKIALPWYAWLGIGIASGYVVSYLRTSSARAAEDVDAEVAETEPQAPEVSEGEEG